MQDEEDALALCNIYHTGLALAARWVYFYNVQRPHFGKAMDKQTPLEVLHRFRYNGPDQIALFAPILLDTINTDLLLACEPEMVTIYWPITTEQVRIGVYPSMMYNLCGLTAQ